MEKNAKSPKEKRAKAGTDLQNNLQGGKARDQSTNVQKEETNVQKEESNSHAAVVVANANEENKEETVEGLKNQLETLMNSLAVLSAEKSKMEANFQSEKRQIRSEREEYERVVKNYKDKLKRIQGHATSEVDHLKYKLIMERHEREKEQSQHSITIKELQKMISSEQKAREQLELQLKELKNSSSTSNKTQNRLLEAELDILKNKLKQAQAAANETPPMLLSLQNEMSVMRKKHRHAILEEQKRAAAAEQEAKVLAASHEARVAGLEARLAELSSTVGGYDRLRQQDQKAIQKLKEQLISLQTNHKSDITETPQQLSEKIKIMYLQLVELDKSSSCSNVKDLLNNLKLCDKSQDLMYKEKYEDLLREFEEYKKRSVVSEKVQQIKEIVNSNDETQLQRAKSHNKNLEEKLRMIVSEMSEKEKEFKAKLEKQQQLMQEQYSKTEQLLSQKDSEYLNKIAALEQQLLKQRERSLSVIQEKDKEIQMLKSSFDALLPKRSIMMDSSEHKYHIPQRSSGVKSEPSDLMSGLLTVENNPPMLHYTQELARKEVQVSSLRKQNVQLEALLREMERNSFRATEKHEEDVKKLENQIKRLEASKSREGANLEYLKNVFINYLTSKDSERKRHMLNAISTILRFTAEESEKLTKHK